MNAQRFTTVAVGNGCKNERYQGELGVHRKMYRLRRLTTHR